MTEMDEEKMDLIYDTCVSNLRTQKLTLNQKKAYMKYLVNFEFHKRNIKALETKEYHKIYLKASFKYAKELNNIDGKKGESEEIFKWIIDNKATFLDEANKISDEDLKVIGRTEAEYKKMLDQKFIVENPNDKTLTDFQKLNYYIEKGDEVEINKFIKNQIDGMIQNQKSICSTKMLESLFEYSCSKKDYCNTFLFFRLYAMHLMERKRELDIQMLNLFNTFLGEICESPQACSNCADKKQACKFIEFYLFNLFNYIPNYQNKYQSNIECLIETLFNLQETKDANTDTLILFLYGLNKYKKNLKRDSEVYFRAASDKNYHKAKYFLSEIVKDSNSSAALNLYKEIIEFNTKEDKDFNLNTSSDKLEKACALYQYGLVYAEGLYSIPVNWSKVDEYWGDPLSDLIITRPQDIKRFNYLYEEYPHLLFIKYKADHGLMDAKHMYFKICSAQQKDTDILVIYMHELCLYSNYDPKYIDEMREYARRLDVGEGVEKDKKKAKMIKDRIKEIENEEEKKKTKK